MMKKVMLKPGFIIHHSLIVVLCAAASCAPTKSTLKQIFLPPSATIDTNIPKYQHNVSQIKSWDRMSQANRATNFAWWDSAGTVHEMFDFYDKVVVLTFFGTWSPPALAQLSAIDTFLKTADTNVMIIGTSLREGVTGGKAVIHIDTFARAHHIDYELLIGSRDFAFTYGGVDAVPTTFVISRKRRIAATLEGYASSRMLLDAIRKAEEMP